MAVSPAAPVPRYLLTIAYDGTHYAGWQRQLGEVTIQERLEDAVARIAPGQDRVDVHGAGRTDAGVHALRQTAHVDVERPYRDDELRRAIQANLPADIAIRSARRVAGGFHARFDAVGKRYVYRCRFGRHRPVHGRAFVHWLPVDLDLSAMRAGARHLLGEHDFAAFSTNPGYPRPRGTVRRVDRLHLIERRGPLGGGFDLAIQGNGFLYNMVRTIAGTLIHVGKGKFAPDDVAEILAAADRRAAGPNAPPEGLFLQRVLYPGARAGTPSGS